MVAVAKAEDKELAAVYLSLLKKNRIEGKLQLEDVPGRRRGTFILVPENRFDEAYEVIQAKVNEVDFYGMPSNGGQEADNRQGEPYRAA